MDADLFVILFSVVVFFCVILSYLTYLPIPVFSYSQGKEKMYGKVSARKKLKGGMTIEISLDQSMSIDPRLKEGNTRIVSAGVTYFAYFRKWQKIPKIGEIIEAETKARSYVLRERSLNWVKSWRIYVGEVPVEITMELIGHHDIQMSPL